MLMATKDTNSLPGTDPNAPAISARMVHAVEASLKRLATRELIQGSKPTLRIRSARRESDRRPSNSGSTLRNTIAQTR